MLADVEEQWSAVRLVKQAMESLRSTDLICSIVNLYFKNIVGL